MIGENGKEWTPKPEQIRCVQVLLNPDCDKKKCERLSEAGIPTSTFYHWMQDDNFVAYLNERVANMTDKAYSDVWKSLVQKARDGDIQAIKLFFEMRHEYIQRSENTNNNFNVFDPEERKRLIDEYIKRQRTGDGNTD